MVARYARYALGDHHAQRRGRNGQGQHGIDVLAKDRRDGGETWWAFQAKHTVKFDKPELTKELKRLAGFPDPLHHYVVITTAPPSTRAQDLARAAARERDLEIAVWTWEDFSERFRDACGGGEWLAVTDRTARRAAWIDDIRSHVSARPSLDPLPLPSGREVPVETVWVAPELSVTRGGPRGATSPRPGDWFRRPGEPEVLALVGEAGAGKTSLLWHVAAERASEAVHDPEAALPVVVSAAAIVGGGGDGVATAMSSSEPGPLWSDLGTNWIVLVDALDEVAPSLRARAEREIRLIGARKNVVGVVVACRDSHVSPGLLGGAGCVSIRSWSRASAEAFAERWATARAEPIGPVRGAIHALEAALSAAYEVASDLPGQAWIARQRMLHAVLVEWPRRHRASAPETDRRLLERLAWQSERTGGPIPRAERVSLGIADAAPSLEAEGRRTGIFSLGADGALTFTHHRVTEALAACELARQPVEQIAAAARATRLSNIAHVAALGRVLREPEELAALVTACRALRNGMIPALQIERWLVRLVDALGHLAGPQIEVAADSLVALATDECWSSARAVILPTLAEVAARGGPLWTATWLRLAPLLAAGTSRGACLQGYAEAARSDATLRSDPAFWMNFLDEEDEWVRAVAAAELAGGPSFDGKTDVLLRCLLDHAAAPFSAAASAVTAGLALREVEEARDPLVETLRYFLRSHRQFPAGAAALALRPGEAPVEELLYALRELDLAMHPSGLAAAVTALEALPGAAEWMALHWPAGPHASHDPAPMSAPYQGELPPSDRVRRQVVSAVAGGFARGGRLADVPEFVRRDAAFLAGMARASRSRPAEVVPVVVRLIEESASQQHPPFLVPDAQADLGEAAALSPDLASALVAWWDSPDLQLRSSFPGIALERLASRGNAEAERVYAAWLPHAPFMLLLSSWWRPPSAEVLATPTISDAARAHCRYAWTFATEGRVDADGKRSSLAPEALGHLLRGLWPSWASTGIPEGLTARALDPQDERWFSSALEAFLVGGPPGALADELVRRIGEWRGRRRWDIDYYSAIAAASSLTWRVAPAFWEMLDDGNNASMWSAAAGLAAGSSAEDANRASQRAAELFPAHFTRGRLSAEQLALLVRTAPEAWIAAVERGVGAQGFWCAAETVAVLRALVEVGPRELRPRMIAVLKIVASGAQPWVPTLGTALFRPEDAAMEMVLGIAEDW